MLSWLYKSAWMQAVVPPILNVTIGVLAATEAAEIMEGSTPVWSAVLRSHSVYVLAPLLCVSIVYQIVSLRHFRALTRAFDARRQHNKLRELTTEVMAEEMKEVIRTGERSGFVTLDHVKQTWGLTD